MANIGRNPFVIVLVVLLAACGILLYSKDIIWQQTSNTYQLNFISDNYKSCEDIVPNISMSRVFDQKNPEFQQAMRAASAAESVEGNSGQILGQIKVFHYLTGQSHVRTVCETGFNMGHSSFNYLTANDQLIVHSFDLGNHKYAHTMSEFMKKTFPNRFFIHFGDSTKTIPEFIRQNPGFKCDCILVDGGHTYPVALADIKNFAMIANLEENVILFDDYPTTWGGGFGKAWDDMITAGVIKEKMRCSFGRDRGRGFTIGRVLKKPDQNATDKQP